MKKNSLFTKIISIVLAELFLVQPVSLPLLHAETLPPVVSTPNIQEVAKTTEPTKLQVVAKKEMPAISHYSQTITPDKDALIEFGLISLSIPAGALAKETEISVDILQSVEPLEPGMYNITSGGTGYRFKPDGTKFLKDITISLPYDTAQVVTDYEKENLYTYYYNTQIKKWEKLKKVAVDDKKGVVISLTNHFTDLINSTLQLPQSPQTLSFNPTSIKDIKAADPHAAIPQIEGLDANPFGSANWKLPLRVPQGRGGATPQLSLDYNSGSGNGFIGKGFDIALPQISIDTRFGVPAYDGVHDIYTFNGGELVATGLEGGYQRYRPRTEGSFSRIYRKGSTAKDYYFEVTEKDGSLAIYGTLDAVVAGPDGIYKWLLKETIDPNGNTIEYSYYTEQGVTYPASIIYSGNTKTKESGKYRIDFEREERTDRRVDARGKFYSKLLYRLKIIKMYFKTELIRLYDFSYQYNLYGESELVRFTEKCNEDDKDGFYHYDFDYYKLPLYQDGVLGFEAPKTISKSEGKIDDAHTISGGGGCYVGAGLSFYPDLSFGANAGAQYDYSFNFWQMLDIDGNGLPDMVYQGGGGQAFKAYLNNGAGFDGPYYFSGFNGRMNENSQVNFNYGVKAGLSYLGLNWGGSIASSWANMTFTDMNADGFADIIPSPRSPYYFLHKGDEVAHYPLQNETIAYGRKDWTQEVSGTIPETKPATETGETENVKKAFYLLDPVRKWRPFRSGTIRIHSDIKKIPDPKNTEGLTGDGVKLNLYQDRNSLWDNIQNEGNWPKSITDDEKKISILVKNNGEQPVAPDVVRAITPSNNIYFKVSSISNFTDDLVDWDATINYEKIRYYENMVFYDCMYLPLSLTPDQYNDTLIKGLSGSERNLIGSLYTYKIEDVKYYLIANAFGSKSENEKNSIRRILLGKRFYLPSQIETSVFETTILGNTGFTPGVIENIKSCFRKSNYGDVYCLAFTPESKLTKEELFWLLYGTGYQTRYAAYIIGESKYPVQKSGNRYYVPLASAGSFSSNKLEYDSTSVGTNTFKGFLVELVQTFPSGTAKKYIKCDNGIFSLTRENNSGDTFTKQVAATKIGNTYTIIDDDGKQEKTYQFTDELAYKRNSNLPISINASLYVPLFKDQIYAPIPKDTFEDIILYAASDEDKTFLTNLYSQQVNNYVLFANLNLEQEARLLDILTSTEQIVSHYKISDDYTTFNLEIKTTYPLADYTKLYESRLNKPIIKSDFNSLLSKITPQAEKDFFTASYTDVLPADYQIPTTLAATTYTGELYNKLTLQADKDFIASVFTPNQEKTEYTLETGLTEAEAARVYDLFVLVKYNFDKQLKPTLSLQDEAHVLGLLISLNVFPSRYYYTQVEFKLNTNIDPQEEIWAILGSGKIQYFTELTRSEKIWDSGEYDVKVVPYTEGIKEEEVLNSATENKGNQINTSYFVQDVFQDDGTTKELPVYIHVFQSSLDFDLTNLVIDPPPQEQQKMTDDNPSEEEIRKWQEASLKDKEPFAGGVLGWFYGEWNGDLTWDPSLLNQIPKSGENYTYFNVMTPLPAQGIVLDGKQANLTEDIQVENHFAKDIWQGTSSTYIERVVGADGGITNNEKFFTSYIYKAEMLPCRKGGDAIDKMPSSSATLSLGRIGEIRKSFNSSNSFGGSMGITGLTNTSGFSVCEQDLMDINGDRYPDELYIPRGTGSLTAIYNSKGDGFTSSTKFDNLFSSLRRNENSSYNLGVTIGGGGSGIKIETTPGGNVKSIKANNASKGLISGGANGSLGVSTTTIDWVDINGDGLLDQIQRNGGDSYSVKLNKGDGFIAQNWNTTTTTNSDNGLSGASGLRRATDVIRYSNTVSAGFNCTFGISFFGISGSANINGNRTKKDLIDMNADGLPDEVFKEDGQPYFYVRFNQGDCFGEPVKLYVPDWGRELNLSDYIKDSIENKINDLLARNGTYKLLGFSSKPNISINTSKITELLTGGNVLNDMKIFGAGDVISYNGGFSISLGANVTIQIGPYIWFIPIALYITPDANLSYGVSSSQLQLRDIDGDNLPDHIFTKDDSDSFHVKYNLAKKVGLLKTIKTPMGGTTTLDYTRTTNSVEMPNSEWVLSSVTRADGMASVGETENTYTVQFDYGTGYYDRTERTFYGFDYVSTIYSDSSKQINYYSNSTYYNKGLLDRSERRDKSGNWYVLDENFYNEELIGSYAKEIKFLKLVETHHASNDPVSGNKIESVMKYDYDFYGNINEAVDFGADSTSEADDVYISILYTKNEARYIVNKPTDLIVKNSSGKIFRKRKGEYDNNGNLKSLEQFNIGKENAITSLAWDEYGNLKRITDPVGYWLEYTYDSEVKSFITQIQDVKGYISKIKHDYKLGVETESTDINKNVMRKDYDAYGRMTNVWSPEDDYPSGTPAIKFDYLLSAFPHRAVTYNKIHFSPSNNETIKTVIIADGLDRVLQTKKEGEIYKDNSLKYGMNVTGRIVYDELGRVKEQGQPIFEEGYSTSYNGIAELKNPTKFDYDILGRTIRTELPDGSLQTATYSIENNQFKTILTDPNKKKRIEYRDDKENIVEVKLFKNNKYLEDKENPTEVEIENALPISTHYEYNLLNEITDIIDDKGYITSIEYDTLGRRTAVINPDTGRIVYVYNAGGDLIQKVTPNLRKKSQPIIYNYDYHKLSSISYPEKPATIYTYGEPNATNNSAGRIAQIIDESGTTTYQYEKLGETTKITKRLHRLTSLAPDMEFVFEYKFDYLGRSEAIKYPDGELLHYIYDRGGQISKVYGEKSGKTFDYITQLGYDEFGQRAYIKYGNGVETRYTYNPERRWLTNIKTVNTWGDTFQDLGYAFDYVGNIKSIENNGNYRYVKQDFEYDDLYQLTRVAGLAKDSKSSVIVKDNEYRQTYDYDSIGNMLFKVSYNKLKPEGISPGALNYNYEYIYNQTKPHQLEHIDNIYFVYDDNGNLIQKLNGQPGTTPEMPEAHDMGNGLTGVGIGLGRDNFPLKTDTSPDKIVATYKWDEDNKLKETYIQGRFVRYLYDALGKRTLKYSDTGETLYVDATYQIETSANPRPITKHIFVGDTRIASKLCYEDGGIGYETTNTYYYHNNHVGTSNYVTDYQGKCYEVTESTPYGEIWLNDGNDTLDKIDYAFTSKIRDKETGLIDFGQRYFDPKYSLWLIADPALGDYIPVSPVDNDAKKHNQSLPGLGGVFNYKNLGLYSFAHNNPVIYADPNGEIVWFVVIAAICAYASTVMTAPDFQQDLYLMWQDYSNGDWAGVGLGVLAAALPAINNTMVKGGTKLLGKFGEWLTRNGDDAAKLILKNSAKGRAFEKAGIELLGVLKNTKNIDGHIVDVLMMNVDGSIKMMVEFKNTKYLSKTKQLETFIIQGKNTFNLIINEGTELSGPLIQKLREFDSKVYRMIKNEVGEYVLKKVEWNELLK